MKNIHFIYFLCLSFMQTTLYAQLKSPIGEWVSIGPDFLSYGLGATGRVTSIAIDPLDSKTIYTGGRGSGVWKTTDGGNTWKPIADELPSLNIQCILIAPTNHNLIYIVTDVGIFISNNAGVNWSPKYEGDLSCLLNSLIIHPANASLLYLVGQKASNNSGVYRSKDGGINWDLILDSGTGTDVLMDHSNPEHLFAAINNEVDISKTGIYETYHGSENNVTWRKIAGCPGGSLPAITDSKTVIKIAQSGNRLYASYKTTTSWTLYRTGNLACNIGGTSEKSWEKCWNPTGSIDQNPIFKRLWNRIYVDPNNSDYVYATGTEMWVSSNGGKDFTRIQETTSFTPHADYHAYAVDPTDSKIILVGTDGGIFRSPNHGLVSATDLSKNWKFIGRGMANTEFFSIATASSKANLLLGATQDNGLHKYEGSKNWKKLKGGDAEFAEISPANNNIFYHIGQNSYQIYKSTNAGDDFSDIGHDVIDSCSFSNEFPPTRFHQVLAHADSSNIVYVTCTSLWKGLPWRKIFTAPSGNMNFMAMGKGSNLLYAGTNNGHLYLGKNSTDFSEIFVHPSNASFTDIEVDPENQNNIYLSFTGSNQHRIYLATKQGAQYNFSDITANLETNTRVNTIAIDRTYKYVIYAGTSQGIYKGASSNNGISWTWSRYNNKLPNAVFITDLEVQPLTGVLRAGTYGRGAYEVNTNNPVGSTLAAEGKIIFLRVHDVGTGWGSGNDFIDAEAIIKTDTEPLMSFGIQLRKGDKEITGKQMIDNFEKAFIKGESLKFEYIKKTLHTGIIIRVINQ